MATVEQSGRIAAILLYFLSFLILFDASMRYGFASGSIMLQELEWHLFDLIILLSIAFTLKHHRHVRVDIFYHRMSMRIRKIIDLIGYVLLVVPFSAVVIYVGFDFVMMSYVQMEGSADPGGLPYRFVIKATMIIGFGLLIMQAIAHTIALLNELLSGEVH
ncbi:MAG: hypothetical protein KU37_08650 [Sulfuricurvum sp. PC08-66]|nr:MAG: hypothetical protein KU37_08650 [Sulfuricurvum sp. PC08-66]